MTRSDIFKYLGTFALGFGCGAGAFYIYSKRKEPVEDYEPEEEVIESDYRKEVAENWDDMNEVIVNQGYRPIYEDRPSFAPTTEEKLNDIPYLISGVEYGNFDYEEITLTYYSDDKLADDHDDLLDDVESIVGTQWRDEFKKPGVTVVYVRNDARKCDYEIALDYRSYNDIVDEKPYLLHNILDSATAMMIAEEEDE